MNNPHLLPLYYQEDNNIEMSTNKKNTMEQNKNKNCFIFNLNRNDSRNSSHASPSVELLLHNDKSQKQFYNNHTNKKTSIISNPNVFNNYNQNGTLNQFNPNDNINNNMEHIIHHNNNNIPSNVNFKSFHDNVITHNKINNNMPYENNTVLKNNYSVNIPQTYTTKEFANNIYSSPSPVLSSSHTEHA